MLPDSPASSPMAAARHATAPSRNVSQKPCKWQQERGLKDILYYDDTLSTGDASPSPAARCTEKIPHETDFYGSFCLRDHL